ncbi:YncE family protein [Amycolatopsis aidingensis]|uniref:YncE family protein n=1 Tax=Amycolatopsis aidingensis TaxID=2842453 RepID=UPI001C0E45CF|nr:serine/threonine protein kinase [Amycolatopsis aidingensis]
MLGNRRFVTLAAVLALVAAVPAVSAAVAAPADPRTRQALFVGNNWDGTVDVLSPDAGLERIRRIDVVPDLDQRLREIYTNPVRLLYFLGIRLAIGEGHDQLVDDMYTTADGRTLVVSRPSLADVVAIDLAGGGLKWRFPVEGQRSDHMAISPDGQHVAVSASTANLVHILDVHTGQEVGRFPSGDSPHENVYSRDGSRIFHASIGHVYTPLDGNWADSTKGARYFQVVDSTTNEVVRRLDMGAELRAAGYPDMSSAVRPMTFSADERFVYFQVSFFHGFIEYDLERDRVTRVASLPIPEEAQDIPREQYPLDSAHHGIAMNPQGTELCVAGTVSDYATIVSQETFRNKGLVRSGTKPYWATPSSDGQYCFVSWSGTDSVSAVSYQTGAEAGSAAVGDHPQRMRLGRIALPG